MIKKIPIDPAYRKDDGLWNLNTDVLVPQAGFEVRERGVIYVPPKQTAGNHKHPRAEAFVGVGNDLYFVWLDENGEKHEERMMPDGQLLLFIVEPFTPHAVVNRDSSFAVLAEFADGPQHDVERANVVDI